MFAASKSLLRTAAGFRVANRGMSASVFTRKPLATISRTGQRGMAEITESAAADVKMNRVLVSPFQKRILVMSNMFPTIAEVPDKVSYQKLKKAKEWFRIRLNIGMALATLIGCLTMIWAGKREHDFGNSVVQENYRWHKKHFDERQAAADAKHVAEENAKPAAA
ncbi:protein FAM162B-like isoform X2 [Lineus longissimus]|uniref:protein FAM162B-like isoform X2 n=1 Tax=Lineus longissimus TaxID=88925 RepID=UPI002B4DC335